MKRDEAISIIINSTIDGMSDRTRQEILFDWWGIDQEHSEYYRLSEALRTEILRFDEPQRDAKDESYNTLIFVALSKKYLGVRNEYLSKRVSEILHSNYEVEGLVDELFTCPCCEFKTLQTKGEYDICPVCYWEDDGNLNPLYYSSPNHMTLAQGRKNFAEFGAVSESLLQFLESDRLDMYIK